LYWKERETEWWYFQPCGAELRVHHHWCLPGVQQCSFPLDAAPHPEVGQLPACLPACLQFMNKEPGSNEAVKAWARSRKFE
jgi:hypothetical protein